MANNPQARKRVRQAEKHRKLNQSQRSAMRTQVKKAVKLIEAKDLERAPEAYRSAVKAVDTMASKGIIHKNKAARHKSRLNRRLKALREAATTA